MPKPTLNEREFELVNIIGADLASNQRDLSLQMKVSLGMVNMLVRRLIAKGFIRIKQLNQKKVKYILTSKGLSEKMQKSMNYTMKTLRSIGLIKEAIKRIVIPLYEKGERNFFVVGESDLTLLIEMVFKEKQIHDYTIQHLAEFPQQEVIGTILICKEGIKNGKYSGRNQVNIIENLVKDKSKLIYEDS
ncbi:MAG: hypothetical protein WC676_00465 [Candidatus Omnitrophota bacterium]